MLVISFILICLVIVSLRYKVHAIGLWLLTLIAHGLILQIAGKDAVHLPLLTGVALAVVLIGHRYWSGVSLKLPMFLLGLFLIMGTASLFGIDREASLVTLLLYSRCFVLALLIAGCLKDEKDLKIITAYCLVGVTIGALAELYQYKTGRFTIQNVYEDRSASLREDPNDTAMILITGIPLALYWFARTSRIVVKGLMAVLVLMLMFGMVLTASRGGFVALAAVTLIMFLRKPSFKSTLLGIFLVAGLLAVAPHSYWDRMTTLVTGHEPHGERSLSSRVTLLKAGLITLADHPLLGVGPGNFGEAFAQRTTKLTHLRSAGPYPVAHNMYLQFFVENGLIGGAWFLAVFVWAAFSLLRYDREAGVQPGNLPLGFAIAAALGGMLLAGLFLSQGLNSVLWFMTGVGFAAGHMAHKKKPGLDAGDVERRPASPVRFNPGALPDH